MNNAKLWLVVKPSVGVPIFLASVAVGSMAVHVAVMTHTSWVSDFLSGEPMGGGDKTAMLLDEHNLNPVKPASFERMADGDRIVVVMPDGQRAVAVIEDRDDLAQAADLRLPSPK
ncbi:MAG: light-harvesting protein [Pseudomonadota bacterium]